MAHAQNLLGGNPLLPQIHARALAWADHDGDGDQDLLAAGTDSLGVRHTYLLRNDGASSFTPVAHPFPALGRAAAAWADLDGDGDSDLVLAGDSARLAPVTRWYMNMGGGSFAAQALAVAPTMDGSVAAGDLDGDGDADLLLAGWNPRALCVGTVLRNEGVGGFVAQPQAAVPGLSGGTASVGDHDGDGDLDILLDGVDALDLWQGRVLRNMGGLSFQAVDYGLGHALRGNLAWADVEPDGDLDVLAAGLGAGRPCQLRRYHPGVYALDTASFPRLGHCLASWCNYDPLQGALPDLLLCGEGGSGPLMRVYHNTGAGFADLQPGNPLPGLADARVAWADWDGDGYLDFAASGLGPGGEARLFLVKYDPTLQRFIP